MFEYSWNLRANSDRITKLNPKILSIINNSKIVLDVGCANAWLSNYVNEKAKYIWLSYSESDINVVKSKWYEWYVVNLDLEKIPLENESVDCIFASHIIEHFEKAELIKLMNEFSRVLKKWWNIILITPTDYNSFFYWEWTHIKPYNHASLSWLLKDFWFRDVEWMYPKIYFLPNKIQAVLRFPFFFLKNLIWKEVIAYWKK